jgi:nucleotide-binding universal stress UspA family protein
MNLNKRKILLAVDGSNQSLEAVRYASQLLPSQQTEIVLFHVFCNVPEFFYDMAEERQFRQDLATVIGSEIQLRESINQFMTEARQILVDAGFLPEGITTDIHEKESGIARDIVVESVKGYDAVMAGRNGINKINDLVIGSVANKLLEKLFHVSVCVVGGKPLPRKVLLGLDDSENAMRALDYVGNLLGGSSHEVTLCHVLRGFSVLEPRFGRVANLMLEKEWLEEGKLVARSVFDEATTGLTNAGFDPKQVTTKLISGADSRSGAIIQEAKEGGYGTIVVGRRGASKVDDFSMGRVSNKVIQMASEQAVWVVS